MLIYYVHTKHTLYLHINYKILLATMYKAYRHIPTSTCSSIYSVSTIDYVINNEREQFMYSKH